MKKSKILVFVLVICFILIVAAGCSNQAKKAYSIDTLEKETIPLYTTATQLGSYTGYNAQATSAYLVEFVKTDANGFDKHEIFNIETETKLDIGEMQDTEYVTYYVAMGEYDNDIPFFVVSRTEALLDAQTNLPNGDYSYTYTLYSGNGTKVAEYTVDEEQWTLYSQILDYLVFDKAVYGFGEDGSIYKIKDLPEIGAELPDISYMTKNNYYHISNKTIFVYDKKFDLVYTTTFVNASNLYVGILNNGDIYVQYYVKKFDTDNDYDLITVDGNTLTKYDVVKKIISIKNFKIKDVKNDYVFNFILSRAVFGEEMMAGFSGKIENLAVGSKIVDKYLQNYPTAQEVVVLENDGSTKTLLTESFVGQIPEFEFYGDKILLSNVIGQKFLYTYDLKFVGDVTNVEDEKLTDYYVISDKSVYDLDLNILYTFDSKYTYLGGIEDTLYFYDNDGKVYRRSKADTDFVEILDILNNFGLEDSYYYTRVEDNMVSTYTVYNYHGTAITNLSSNYAFNDITSYNNKLLLRTSNANDENIYYIVK